MPHWFDKNLWRLKNFHVIFIRDDHVLMKEKLALVVTGIFSYSYEYMDLARHINYEGYLENILKYLKSKYLNDQPDFIITAVSLYSFFFKI